MSHKTPQPAPLRRTRAAGAKDRLPHFIYAILPLIMKAHIKPRIQAFNRLELKDAIPLRTPWVVYIDPSDKCNFRCKFCPTGEHDLINSTYGRGHGFMDFNKYKEIINSLGEFEDKIKVISLYKDGEPLLNPRFADMVKYAKQSGACEKVDTTTNASLLSPELSLKIIESGLDRINISIEGVNAEQYADFSRYKINYENFVDNIAYFYEHKKDCEMNIKINGDILNEQQTQQFFEIFGNITDEIYIEHAIDYWPTFQQEQVHINKDITILGQAAKEVRVCPYVFYEQVINSDGSFSLCRFDWKHNLVLGGDIGGCKNPKKVWNSAYLWHLHQMFLRGERYARRFCANCGELKQGIPEDLDEFAEMLLDRM